MTYVVVGRFGKAHGVMGAVTLQSFTEPSENILRYFPWFVKTGKIWEEIKVDSVEQRGKKMIARVAQVNDRDKAAALTNLDIAVSELVLPKLSEGEYYWQQLIGMSVTNLKRIELGKVAEVMATGSNDVLVIEGRRRYLIPFLLDRHVQSIDLNLQEMIVDWDEAF